MNGAMTAPFGSADSTTINMKTGKHIVDQLIEERAPRLAASPLWPVIEPVLRALLGYKRACAVADAIAPLTGEIALAHVSNLLRLNVDVCGEQNIPQNGRIIIVVNHPTGIADGIAMHDAITAVRSDVSYFANADALRVCDGFKNNLIPVAWPPEKRTMQATKRTVRLARQALDDERVVVIFAAGALSRPISGVLRDPVWEHSAVTLARKHDAPITPVHISGPYPLLFHLFERVSKELRDITLFHELLNKAGGDYRLTFGARVNANAFDESSESLTVRLKTYVEQILPGSPDIPFP